MRFLFLKIDQISGVKLANFESLILLFLDISLYPWTFQMMIAILFKVG